MTTKPESSYVTRISSGDLKSIIDQHYKFRDNAIRQLNTIWSSDDTYKYPNLDFISHHNRYFYHNNRDLCGISPTKQFGRGKAGTAYLVKLGTRQYIIKVIYNIALDQYLSLNIHTIDNYDSQYLAYSPSIVYNSHICEHNGKRFRGIIGVTGGNFTNQTVMHMIINAILDKEKTINQNFVYQYDAYTCSGTNKQIDGYNIMDLAKHGDLSDYIEHLPDSQINDTLIINIMSQLLPPLALLKCKKYGFTHNDLKCKNVFVDQNNGGIICKLADFDKSGIYWNKIRFNTRFESQLIKTTASVLKHKHKGYPVYIDSVIGPYYKIYFGPSGEQIYTMYTSKPMHMSFDIYTLVLSLVREPNVYNLYKTGKLPIITTMLELLFDRNDLSTVLHRIDHDIEQYNKYLMEQHINPSDVSTDHLVDALHNLRSITRISASLGDIKLKVDVTQLYHLFDSPSNLDVDQHVEPVSQLDNKVLKLSAGSRLGGSYHVCVDQCKNHKCTTNSYSSLGYVYEYDNC